jgi:hypothetical protein
MNPAMSPSANVLGLIPPASWVLSALLVFGGAVANRLPFASLVQHPAMFFLLALLGVASIQIGIPHLGFAFLFFLLSAWSMKTVATEGFLNGFYVDEVENKKRWYVEEVLKEDPKGIQTKQDATAAVGAASAQGGTSAGTT